MLGLPEGTRIQILSPIVRGRKGEYKNELLQMRKSGYVRARIDGEMRDLSEDITLKKSKKHDIEIVIDRLIIKKDIAGRLSDSIEYAIRLSDGLVIIHLSEVPKKSLGLFGVPLDSRNDILYSERLSCPDCGISYPELTPRFFSFNSPYGACPMCDGLGTVFGDGKGINPCFQCSGSRLRKEALSIKIKGLSIADISRMTVKSALSFFRDLVLTDREMTIASRILKEITERLSFMMNVGLDYLTLDRSATTLAGGEAQRIRLATQIGSSLTGVLYILDEPSIGLHQRDNRRLLDTLSLLRDLGNTVLIVEHDEETIRRANYIIDMGPGAGTQGGRVVASGTLSDIIKSEESLTAQYLKKALKIPVPPRRRKSKGYLTIIGAKENNLKEIDVRIPLGVLTCITGVSGSGKSTLLIDILYKALLQRLHNKSSVRSGSHSRILNADAIDKVVEIDQSPIGRTPRSNPATYVGVFTHIRDLFAQTPDARMKGYKAGRFSFNVKGGRCESCRGDGVIKIGMHFLPDVYVTCDVCKGKRYNRETLEIRYKGKNIAEVLEATVSEALEFLINIPYIKAKLQTLEDVGLGYITLGQPATTLSGGEAQRIKLSKELSKRETGRTLYILDEPTTGLHFDDIKKLLNVLNRLADNGNTVVVIEHHLDVIKTADYIIDLGPEGGDEGGWIVAEGTPEEVSEIPGSYTGQFLRKILENE